MARNKTVGQGADSVVEDSCEYLVTESSRARHVHLKLSWRGDLEVVVPRGYHRRAIPQVIAAKQAWLQRTRARLLQQARTLPAEYFEVRPTRVLLCALSETHRVEYRAASHETIRVAESDGVLAVSGPIDEPAACVHELRAWLRSKARARLIPWLRQTSHDVGLPYAKTIIRRQRSRWGSCSARGVISLNCKLLFLPHAEVHYLFVHELCHTRHLNHSKRYWALVERKLPDFHRFEAALRDAWRYVPRWAED